MKILMFGWEFPPHISGGLGTACYGLTRALIKKGLKVLFVVPQLFGGEKENFLINASDVSRKLRSTAGLHRRPSPSQSARTKYRTPERHSLTYIGVPSYLSPYQHAHEGLTVDRRTSLQSWNYSLIPAETANAVNRKSNTMENNLAIDEGDGSFRFSGEYGSDLMNEVGRYAEVAGIIASDYSFDVIHVHDWMTFPAGIAAKKKSGKPLVVHVHSTEFDRAGDNISHPVFEIEKEGLQQADKIIAVSNWTKQILMSRYDIPEEKIKVVHNGIIPRKQMEDYQFPDIGSHFVTFLGRITHQKGPWLFVEAAKKVLQEFPEAHFIVAGAGDLLPQTIEQVAQLNMSSNFHFTGFLSPEQVDQIWSLTDVYVMPSVSEPFGIAPLEAIQGGVPVILSNQSGVSEVMPHAIKVDFWDVKALAAAICSVLRYESLSHVLRQNSKRHIQYLTWEKAAADVKEIYNELTT